jgi:hypothetical protein
MWYNTFDSFFWITITTLLTGSIGLSLKFCLKSKCDNVNLCWGMIKVHRNTELEENNIDENEENKI